MAIASHRATKCTVDVAANDWWNAILHADATSAAAVTYD